MKKIKKINFKNKNLWCNYSKEKIEIGEDYYLVFEEYFDEEIIKPVKAEYIDFIDDEDSEGESNDR